MKIRLPPPRLPCGICALLASGTAAAAGLIHDLLVHLPFETTGDSGLLNQAPGATTFHALRSAGGSFDASANPSGPGFAGMAAFNPGNGPSDRSQVLLGKALNLVDTRNDAITLPISHTDLGENFTLSLWHALTPSGGSVARPFVFEGTDNYNLSWGIASGDSYTAYVTQAVSLPYGTLERGPWHHTAHVFTSDGTTTTLTLYINGQPAGTRSAATASLTFSGIHFGKHRGTDHTRNWDGMLDDIALWKRPLSAAEIAEIHLKGRHGLAIDQSPASAGKALVRLDASPPSAGTLSGSGLHPLGSTLPIRATARPGFTVTRWSGDLAGQSGDLDWLLTTDLRATAHFGPDLADDDGDGLSNHDEIILHGTDPTLPDTDGDGLPDGTEIKLTRTHPNANDSAWIEKIRQSLFAESAGILELATPHIQRRPHGSHLTLPLRAGAATGPLHGLTFEPARDAILPTPEGFLLEIHLPEPSPNHFLPRTTQP